MGQHPAPAGQKVGTAPAGPRRRAALEPGRWQNYAVNRGPPSAVYLGAGPQPGPVYICYCSN
ncbi:hypothetical protein AXW84_04660 [Hymenobacter sp. PAMC 26628]|nr:hypothetical protein AXW84_04660 [Hymenobacter sp. PAMC 26628]